MLLVEYPYHDPDTWSPLTPELLIAHWSQIIVQAALIIDLIHHLDMVHLDLKLENFHARVSDYGAKVKLADLDFLTTSGKPLGAKIIGTPAYSAPEVLANDEISARTDNFSFGQSLKHSLWDGQPEAGIRRAGSRFDTEKVRAFVIALTDEYPAKRPTFVLDALRTHGLVGDQAYAAAQKRVLSLLFLGRSRCLKTVPSNAEGWLKAFLQEKNKVFGIPDELIRDLEQAFAKDRAGAVYLFRSLLAKGSLSSFGEFWHLELSDENLADIYRQISARFFQNDPPTSWHDHRANLKSFLINKGLLGGLDAGSVISNQGNRREWLEQQAELALALNRSGEAIEYLRKALDAAESNTGHSTAVLQKLTHLLMVTGSYRECAAMARRGIAESTILANRETTLEFQRELAGTFAYQGDTDSAAKLLAEILQEAEALGILPTLIRVYNSLAALEWRKGNTAAAIEHYRKAYSQASKSEDMSLGAVSLVGLALLYSEMAEYTTAIRMGTQAAKHVDKDRDPTKPLLIYEILAWCHQSLGHHEKAEYWANKFISEKSPEKDQRVFLEYYIMKGWVKINQGAIPDAKEALYRALELSRSTEDPRRIGKAAINLAEIALAQGMPDLCRRYCSQARESFEKVGDHASLSEVELIVQLNLLHNSDDLSGTGLVKLLAELIERNCRYASVVCLFHILVSLDDESRAEALTISGPLLKQVKTSKTPLFRAVSNLIDLAGSDQSHPLHKMSHIKSAFGILESSGQTYLAAMLARKIGEVYIQSMQQKLGRKFLDRSRQLAESLDNNRMSTSILDSISSISDDPDERKRLVQTIFGVSSILQNTDQYDKATRRIVQFAVEETGAERGALLLKSAESEHLVVRSYWNCDELSLQDIVDFSTTIPEQVADGVSPVVVSDALRDKRTKNYKSIVKHNIRSVICVPIKIRDGQKGILYLDHHTIPALFDDDDLTFVKSLANFLSLMLSAVRHIRTVGVNKRRVEDELVNLGFSHRLITRSDRMLDIIEKLPQIARSKTSVLIAGQSGTGKEVLSQMLHSLSPRATGPLVKLNCAAIPSDLIESELFGVAKGVATGVEAREGKFEAADGGTLFLDEIGDLPVNVQAKVLRVLEYQEFERVGSHRRIYVDIRFVYATNRDLKDMVDRGAFREDLFHRINTIVIEVPSLRDRPEDVELLIDYFAEVFSPNEDVRPRFTGNALRMLESHTWPGNVRELRNFVENCCILHPGREFDVADLPDSVRSASASADSDRETRDNLEKARIREALETHNWNKAAAARHLGMSRTTLRRKMKKYRISRTL
jgi:Nif-specific regulatory protein